MRAVGRVKLASALEVLLNGSLPCHLIQFCRKCSSNEEITNWVFPREITESRRNEWCCISGTEQASCTELCSKSTEALVRNLVQHVDLNQLCKFQFEQFSEHLNFPSIHGLKWNHVTFQHAKLLTAIGFASHMDMIFLLLVIRIWPLDTG